MGDVVSFGWRNDQNPVIVITITQTVENRLCIALITA